MRVGCPEYCALSAEPGTTALYTLSLHDALPDLPGAGPGVGRWQRAGRVPVGRRRPGVRRAVPRRGAELRGGRSSAGGAVLALPRDRKSTRLNSSHTVISYAVFCLKKKNSDNARRLSRVLCSFC